MNLAEALPIEQARVRKVLGHYKAIGSAGMFGAAMIEQSLAAADKASAEGDVVAMVRAYADLQTIKD
jgi:acyl-CoA thioesterase